MTAKDLARRREVIEIVLVVLAWIAFGWKAAGLMFLLMWYVNVVSQTGSEWLWADEEMEEECQKRHTTETHHTR